MSRFSTLWRCLVSVPTLSARPLGLTASPNPSATGFRITWSADRAVRRLRVHDVRGRVVRQLLGRRSAEWDGRSESGSPLPGGVYWIRAESENGAGDSLRIVLLR